MSNNESIYSFRTKVQDCIDMLDNVGIKVSEQEQAEQFMDKLHCGYEGLITEQVRGLQNGLLEYPKNLKEAYMLAFNYTPKVRPQATTMTVFSTGVEEEGPRANPRKKGDRSRRRGKDDKSVKDDKNMDDVSEVAPTKSKLQCYLCNELGHSVLACPKLVDAQNYLKSLVDDEKAVDAILKEW